MCIELLWHDVSYGLRQLRRNLGFTLTAVVTLGLGIGATTAIFSAVYSLLVKPLPYHEANRLVSISSAWPKSHSDSLLDPDFVAARSETKSFEQFAGFHIFSEDNLTGTGDPERITRAAVSANFLPTLGVLPKLGRNFSRDEDWSGGPNVLLLSDHLWRNKFNADPQIVGKTITLNGVDYTVIGVLPSHFSFPSLSLEPDLYGPVVLERDSTVSIEKQLWGIQVIARLRPGATIEQAQAEMQTFFQARAHEYPVQMASFAKERQMIVEPLQRHLTGDDRKPLYILLMSVAAVLLISCTNVANLQLVRAVSRRHETALRGALGASRPRLIRQFLVESLILSLLAAALGLIIAVTVTAMIKHAGMLGSQTSHFARAEQLLRLPFGKVSAVIEVDGWVLAFTVSLALLTTLLFGLTPAISGSRTDLRNALQSAAMRISAGREQRLLRHGLLVMELGLAVLLLASAGLLVRSFVHVMSYDSGFDASNILTGVTSLHTGVSSLSGPSTAWSTGRYLNFVDQLLLRLTALPGVKAAALTSALPLDSISGSMIVYEGLPIPPPHERLFSPITEITPDYFRAVGTPILIGRAFNSADNETSPLVAIVNLAFAKRFFAGDALGKRFKTNSWGQNGDFKTFTIVGIVADVRHGGPEQDVQPEAFCLMSQVAIGWTMKLVLRTSENPALLANAMRAAVTAVDARQPVFDIETMDQRVSDILAQRRLIMLLIACFAMLAVFLAAVGVYGVFSYAVTQRAQEMGIRLALGASRNVLLRLVVMQAGRLIATGGVIGISGALLLSRLLTSLLVGVTAHDAVSFSLAWALMTIVALLASTIPAARAARTDLVYVLHSE